MPSPHSREVLKSKLLNWLQMAAYNGYTQVYFKSGITIPVSAYGENTAASVILGNESFWTQRTKDILNAFVANMGQALDRQLRIHAYGEASNSQVRYDLEYTYGQYLANVEPGTPLDTNNEFANWYTEEYLPLITDQANVRVFSFDPDYNAPAGGTFTPRSAESRYRSILEILKYYDPLAFPPGAITAYPKGSGEYISYMRSRNDLEFAAMSLFEGQNGDMDEYATKILKVDPSLKKKDLDKQYLLSRSTYVGNIMQMWRKGQPLPQSQLRQFNDEETKDLRAKIDPHYIISSYDIHVGALQHVTEFSIETVNELGSSRDIIFWDSPLPYMGVDSVPKLLQKSQDGYSPWYESAFDTVNLIVNSRVTDSDIIRQAFGFIIPIDLGDPTRVSSDTPNTKDALKIVLSNTLGDDIPTAVSRIEESLVSEDGDDSPLANYTEAYVKEMLPPGDGLAHQITIAKRSTAEYLLKFLDKVGSPTLTNGANRHILNLLIDKVFIVNRFTNLAGELCFHTVINRGYLDVIPRQSHQMDLYEETFGAGSYYGEFYEQRIPLAGFKDKLIEFKSAMEAAQNRFNPADLADSSKGWNLAGRVTRPPSQHANFEKLIKITPDGKLEGTLANFLNANADRNNPVIPEKLFSSSTAELVFVYNMSYALKGLYVIDRRKIPLNLGFDKFAHDEAVSAQNISFLSNMDNIIEDEKSPSPSPAKEMIKRYILMPPKFKKKHANQMTPGVKTRDDLLKEARYLGDPEIQRQVHEATKKNRHFAGTAEFASLEQTAKKVEEISNFYSEFVAEYGIAQLARELQRCLVELLGLTWTCETQLQLALDALGVERFRQVVLVPAFQLGGLGADIVGDVVSQHGAKTAEALRPVRARRKKDYTTALAKIDTSYNTLSSEQLSAEFQKVSEANTGLENLDAQTRYNRQLEEGIVSGTDYIKELSKQADLEVICRNLGDYLLQLVQFLTNPDMQDDDISYKLPKKNPKMALPRDDEPKKRDLYEEALIAMEEAWEKVKEQLLSQLLQAVLKMLVAVCQQLRRDLAAGTDVHDPPPISRDELADLFGALGPKLPLSGPGALAGEAGTDPAVQAAADAEAFLDQLLGLLDLISGLLTPSQLCMLLEGDAPQEVLQLVLDQTRTISSLASLFTDLAAVRQVFMEIGATIDPEYCESILAVTDEQLADLCNLPPDAIPAEMREALQDALDKFAKLPTGPIPPPMGDPCDPIVDPDSDTPPPPPPQKPLMDWKAIPAIVAANDLAIDIFYEDTKGRFNSTVTKTLNSTIETSTEETEVTVTLGDDARTAINRIAESVAIGRAIALNASDFNWAAEVHIAKVLEQVSNAAGFKRFVTPTKPSADANLDHPLARAKWLYYYYMGKEFEAGDTPLTLPGAIFLDVEYQGFLDGGVLDIAYIRDAQAKQKPLKKVFDYLQSNKNDMLQPMPFLDGVGASNSILMINIPSDQFELAYPGKKATAKLSDGFKTIAFTAEFDAQRDGVEVTRPAAFKAGTPEQFGLNFRIQPTLHIVDLSAEEEEPNRDRFKVIYQKQTQVTQPGITNPPNEPPFGISDVRQYDIDYYDFSSAPNLYPAATPTSKPVAFFKLIEDNLTAKGAPPLIDSRIAWEIEAKQEYTALCDSMTTQVYNSVWGIFQNATQLSDIEFIPKSYDRLQRSRGFMRKQGVGYNDEGLPKQEYIKLPPMAPHGDLLGLSVLKDKVREEFSKNPVCDPVGDPAAGKDISPLARASIAGVMYLFMRIYTLEFLLKMYPLIATFNMLDIFNSNVVPMYITQKIKMELSKDKGFYCDFVQTIKKMMRDRKNRGDQSLRVDPIGGQPIQVTSLDDMIVFMLKEQVPSLVGEFDFIMKDHVDRLRAAGEPDHLGGVFENPELKTRAEGLFLPYNQLYQVPWSRVVKPFDFADPSTYYRPSLSDDRFGQASRLGTFFFQKYVRVVDKPSPVPGVLGAVLSPDNRPTSRVSETELDQRVTLGQGNIQEQVNTPDLAGVVNYDKWNDFWDASVKAAAAQNPSAKITEYFDRLALGVRLVYMPPVPDLGGQETGIKGYAHGNVWAGENNYARWLRYAGGPAAEASHQEKMLNTYEYIPAEYGRAAALGITTLPIFEKEYVLTDSYSLSVNLEEWGAEDHFNRLQEEIKNSEEYRSLSQNIFPTDRLYGTAFLGLDLLTTSLYRDTDGTFDAVKKALKKLYYVLVDDEQINRCKDTDLMDALFGLDWDDILGSFGLDIQKMIIDAIVAIITGALGVLGSDLVGGITMMILKLLLCPILPTTKDSELLGGFGERMKDEWGCFDLRIPDIVFPEYVKPDPGGKTACPTGQLKAGQGGPGSAGGALGAGGEECLDPVRYDKVYTNAPLDEILMPPVELPDDLTPNAGKTTYRTKSELDAAQERLRLLAAEAAEA